MAKLKELIDRISRILLDAGFQFERKPLVGGLTPDFALRTSSGKLVVVEAKPWDPRGGNTARALEQAKLYKNATGADDVFLVLDGLKRNFRDRGVVNPDALEQILGEYPRLPTAKARKGRRKPRGPRRTVFAAMPFEREYDDTYFVAMIHAAQSVGAACERVDRTEFTGDIVAEIKRLIDTSIAVIVDLSESKPNVLYEAGYAHAKRKPTVHICSTPLTDLPFNVRNWNTLEYCLGQTAKLRIPLARRLRSVLR